MGNTHKATAFIFFLGLFFYLYSLQPSLSWGDGTRLQQEALTGESFILSELDANELAFDPYPFARLGIAAWDHPLYVVLGYSLVRAGSWIPTVQPLWWVNAVSALFGAAALAVFFHISLRQSGWLPGAVLASLALMVSHTFWWHAATPEVYTLHVFLLLLCLACLLAYIDSASPAAFYGGAFCFGLALSNHFMAALLAPGLWIGLAWAARRRQALPPLGVRRLLSAAAFALAGALLLWVQALRMLRSFPLPALLELLLGATFFQNLTFGGTAASLATYLVFLSAQFSPIGLILGLLGLGAARRERPVFFSLLLPLYALYALFGVLYQVVDQFAFHLTSYVFFALWIPFGLKRVYAQWPRRWAHAMAAAFAAWIVLSPALLANMPQFLRSQGIGEAELGIPQIGSGVRDGLDFYLNPNKRLDLSALHFGLETLTGLPPGSLVLAEWYTDTDEYFIFRYFQTVEGLRPDVEVAGWPLIDPFSFDPQLAAGLAEHSLPARPVYLSSLSDDFYRSSDLAQKYCVFPSDNLYRVLDRAAARTSGQSCLAPEQLP